MKQALRAPSCGCENCSGMVREGLARRGFLRFATASMAGIALAPIAGHAAGGGGYQAMLLSCVDPRTQAPIAEWMNEPVAGSHAAGLKGKYSQFTMAGAAVGVIAPSFSAWRQTFWDNLGASIQLHAIRTLLVVDHGNCGALGIAYGQNVLEDPKQEFAAHMADAKALQQELALRHPDLAFQAWYIDRDPSGAFTVWKNLVQGPVIGQ